MVIRENWQGYTKSSKSQTYRHGNMGNQYSRKHICEVSAICNIYDLMFDFDKSYKTCLLHNVKLYDAPPFITNRLRCK